VPAKGHPQAQKSAVSPKAPCFSFYPEVKLASAFGSDLDQDISSFPSFHLVVAVEHLLSSFVTHTSSLITLYLLRYVLSFMFALHHISRNPTITITILANFGFPVSSVV